MPLFTFIDLFCGIGGFHIALKELGGECVFASDIDKDCREVYFKNFQIEPKGDITKISEDEIPIHDVLVGGFPCQAHSNAGHKKAFDDKRGKLFDEIVRIAKSKKPKIMLLENVKHIKKVKDATVYKYIYESLNDIGYDVQDIELSPHQFGVPQQRSRVYFICLNKSLYDPIKIDVIPEKIIHNIFEEPEQIDRKYFLNDELCKVIDVWNQTLNFMSKGESISVPILLEEFYKQYNNFEGLPDWKITYIRKNKELYEKYKSQWDDWYNIHQELLKKKAIYSKLEWQVGRLKENDSIWNYFIQLRQSGIRVKKNDNFPTLVAIVQVPIYGKQKRYLTPRECARLQSFPDTFQLHHNDKIAYKQLGNSVNVHVISNIMMSIMENIMFT